MQLTPNFSVHTTVAESTTTVAQMVRSGQEARDVQEDEQAAKDDQEDEQAAKDGQEDEQAAKDGQEEKNRQAIHRRMAQAETSTSVGPPHPVLAVAAEALLLLHLML